MTAPAAMAMNEEQDQVGTPKKLASSIEPTTPKTPSKGVLYYLSFGYYGGSNEQQLLDISTPAALPKIDETPPRTFRTTGVNPNAEAKYSAIYMSFLYHKTPDTTELIINHRTKENSPEVRVYNPKAKAYITLGNLPLSKDFTDAGFNLSPLIEAMCDDSSSVSTIKTELNFKNGSGDIHSFKIQSGGKTLKEVILGNQDSEIQSGVHVYAGDTQEWSDIKHDDAK